MNSWYNIIDLPLFSKTISAHSLIIISYSTAYYFLSRIFNQNLKWPSKELINIPVLVSIVLLTNLVKLSSILSGGFSGSAQYISLFISFIREPAEIILVGTLACKFHTKSRGILFILCFAIIYWLLPQIIFPGPDGVYSINRGRTFSVIIASLCFLNFQKWQNQLFSKSLLIIAIPLSFISLGGLVMIEGLMSKFGDTFSFKAMLINFSFGFEPIIFDNAATVIQWIDNGFHEMRYGLTYLQALDGFNLFGVNFVSPNEWYVWERNPEYASTGGRYNFSAVAEGYLNGGMIGVFIHGIILSIISIIVRNLLFTRFLFPYNVVFFAPMILIVNTLNRKDMMGIFGTFEILFIGSFLLCLISLFIERIVQNKNA